MPEDSRFFMKPSQSFYDSFAGCDVRWLSEPTGLSRTEFKAECAKIIAEAESKASARGLSEEEVNEVRLNTMRQLGESSLFFFCVSILGLVARDDKTGEIIEGFVDSDYGYRLCLDVQENKWKKLWVLAREHYKDLACDTPILTTEGWKRHGDLVPGDVVFTPNGTSPVVAVRHFTDSHCRKVNFRGGNSIVCGNGHLWKAFRYTRDNKVHPLNGQRGVWFESVCETSELMSTSYRHPYIEATGYHIEDDIELPIPPYTLGAWLGDGESASGRITKPDDELFDNIRAEGFEISHNHYRVEGKHCQTRTIYGLMPLLKEEGLLKNKHIPAIYFQASDRQRLALLQGLMDTDGSMPKNPKNGASFCSSRKELAEDVLTLANSLGFKAMMSPVRTSGAWSVTFAVKASDPCCPFRLPRKAANISDKPHQKQAHNWYIQSIDEYETVPTNCIQIADPDGIYLAGKSLIPTHNSTIITCASTLWEIIRNPNATFCIYSYKEDMAKKFLGQIRGWIEDIPLVRALWPDIFWENPALGYEDLPNGQRKRWAWTSTEIEVKRRVKSKEKTIEVAGIGGNSKTGAHFRYQIFDDAETIGSVGSPEAIDSLYQSVMMAFNTGQTGKLDFCFVGTFYARADVYYRMLKNGIFRQAVIQPCVDKDGKPILFSYEALEEKYRSMGASVFATQMMCDPSFNSSATFKAEWVRRWSPNPEGLNVYVVVDPASGKTSKKHDFTVMLAFGIDSLGNILVLDMIRDKIGLEQKFISLASFVQRYNPVRIYYEQVSMQQDISSLEMLMDKYHTRFALIPFNPTKWGDKGARIEKLRNKFEYQQVYLPESCVHANFEGANEDMISTFYYDEYLGYPTVMHDDALDCLSSANLLYTDGELQAPVNQTLSRKIREREALDDDYSPFAYAVRGSYGMFEAEYEDLGEPEPMLPFDRGQGLA